LAGLIHVFEGTIGPITAEAFNAARLVVQWHLDESNRFFTELSLPDELADAVRLERWMIGFCSRNATAFIRKNDLRQKGPLRDKILLQSAISELLALKRIRIGKSGRADVIFINPLILTPKTL
jgi:hypothetical protein